MTDLICGDSYNVLKKLSDASVDMILTDPPYSITSLNLDQKFDITKFLPELKRILKPNGWFFCFGSVEMTAVLSEYFRFKFQYIWKKPSGVFARPSARHPFMKHENLWVYIQPTLKRMTELYMDKKAIRTKGKPYVRGASIQGTGEFNTAHNLYDNKPNNNDGYREGTTILEYPNKLTMKYSERTKHPTQKPLAMIETLLRGYCPKDGVVLDPFVGSGTTAVAAISTGRRFIAVEIVPEYYDIAFQRIQSIQTTFPL